MEKDLLYIAYAKNMKFVRLLADLSAVLGLEWRIQSREWRINLAVFFRCIDSNHN